MSGRREKELQFEKRIEGKLDGMPTILTEYYYHLIGSGKSYATTYNYINYIVMFLEYTFDSIGDDFYKRIAPLHINKYISSLRTKVVGGVEKRTSDSIKTVHWSALNSFFDFLVPDYIKENPVSKTSRPKMKDNPNVTYLTKDEISTMLDYVESIADVKVKNRDLCILKLGFSTGLRASAIMQMDIDDIDFANGQIRVTEKGDYDQYIMFGDNLKSQLLLWLEDRSKYFGKPETNALFLSRSGDRIKPTSFNDMFKKYGKAVPNKKITPHVMRHSCATNLYEQTGDIYLCARQLNHKNVSTTQRYAEISKEKQRSAANILDNLI